ncbi:hypothetical protein SAY86_024675 [Trapa natans]|uniref:Uncharacterized protein n=1 Tax=Trapa natans TaxID=22666 RepID=A0AAN7REI9_TRANT|nr:hypothetical protein SAY86_024675 [Trapa natans]
MGEGYVVEFDVKELSLIDVSFEDDCLIDTSTSRHFGPQFLDGELLHHLDLEKADEEGKDLDSEPLEFFQECASKKPEDYHLRKSLAWDTAFFTGDGVLEPEELTSMIENGKKEKHKLPMILEETRRSMESISTLASDTLTLESLEADLFEDIRASIQKSTKTFNIQTFGGGTGQSSSRAHAHHSLRKRDLTSPGKLKLKPTPKSSSQGMIRPGKKIDQVPGHRRVSQVPSVAEGVGSSSLPSKPPKSGFRNPIPSSKKMDSLGPSDLKPIKNNIEDKLPVSTSARSLIPRSSLVRAASVKADMITPSSDSLASNSDKSRRTSVNLGSKAGPKLRKSSSASSFMLETPPTSNSSCLSSHLMSTIKVTSSTSPASSISEWSLDSSSLSSNVEQRSNDSKASFEPSSSDKSSDGDDTQQLDVLKSCGYAISNLHVKHGSTGKTLLPDTIRPSSLRMPSPKIGFFDGMKSGPTPNAEQRSPHVTPIGLLKVRATSKLDGSMNRGNIVKSQPPRATTRSNSMKGDVPRQHSAGNHKSLPLESSSPAEKVSRASRNVNDSSLHTSLRGVSRVSPRSGSRD